MIKLLHSGDWHLDSPFQGRTEQQAERLRRTLQGLPGKIADLCLAEGCQLVLLSGDLFDGAYTQASYRAVYDALERMAVPVFIAPGNHDYISPESPYERELWPENVFIFKGQDLQWVDLPDLDLRVYGAGFQSMDCPSLLTGFHSELPAVAVLHGDPTQVNSPYNPVTKSQVTQSGLLYLALGHVHKTGRFFGGNTLCAWPGCPMGRGWDEQGEKGVLLTELGEEVRTSFLPLDTPRFYDLEAEAAQGPAAVLPGTPNEDFYRVTLTGEAETVDLEGLQAEFAAFPNLVLRDHTCRPLDLWQSLGQDNFEGMYFGLLKAALEEAQGEDRERILLAARMSRQLLEGQEVALP